jgi:hypothetical protein
MRNNRIEKACIRINVPTPTGFFESMLRGDTLKIFFQYRSIALV